MFLSLILKRWWKVLDKILGWGGRIWVDRVNEDSNVCVGGWSVGKDRALRWWYVLQTQWSVCVPRLATLLSPYLWTCCPLGLTPRLPDSVLLNRQLKSGITSAMKLSWASLPTLDWASCLSYVLHGTTLLHLHRVSVAPSLIDWELMENEL